MEQLTKELGSFAWVHLALGARFLNSSLSAKERTCLGPHYQLRFKTSNVCSPSRIIQASRGRSRYAPGGAHDGCWYSHGARYSRRRRLRESPSRRRSRGGASWWTLLGLLRLLPGRSRPGLMANRCPAPLTGRTCLTVPPAARWTTAMPPRAESGHPRGGPLRAVDAPDPRRPLPLAHDLRCRTEGLVRGSEIVDGSSPPATAPGRS
jgi:hypothetical protein